MTSFVIQEAASYRLDDIYNYTYESWGEVQANKYIHELFEHFQKIADHEIVWRSVPAEFEVEGFFCHFQKQFIYWKELSSGEVGIVTILHERMHRIERLREDFQFSEKDDADK